MNENHPHEVRRTTATVEWNKLPIVGDQRCPKLSELAVKLRWIIGLALAPWAGMGLVLWYLL